MAVDKLVDSTQLNSDLTSVANAIRAKSGGSSQLAFPAGFVSEIGNIPSGGGNGGLANMVDVNSQDYQFAYMLMKLKKGETVGGTVTFTSAFANTSQLLIATGLTVLHGIIFASPEMNIDVNEGGVQSNKFLMLLRNSDNSYNLYGIGSQATDGTILNKKSTPGTLHEGAPTQGTITFDGGDFYYAARYNKNANYQILQANKQFEWIAW